ncbi:MAG: hypothetical protein [Methanosarcina spindle-shaped virus 1]
MSYYQDGGGGNPYSKNSGMKGLERYDITLRVIDHIENSGELYAATRFTGISQETYFYYTHFVKEFYKLYESTGMLLNESAVELLADIGGSFAGPVQMLTPKRIDQFLIHSEDYVFELKEAGVYDPTITRQMYHPGNAWERSI